MNESDRFAELAEQPIELLRCSWCGEMFTADELYEHQADES